MPDNAPMAEPAGPVLALIPVNRLDRAKGRLAGELTPAQREALARATLATVLAAVRDAGAQACVLTADSAAAALAAAAGARVIAEDPPLSGLNAQLERAIAMLEAPAGGVLVLHADLPLATGADIAALVAAAAPAPSVTIVASGDGGTNAMLLRPPGRFALGYGPGSCERHVAAASEAGVAPRLVDLPALALDLDTPADVAAFLAHPGGPGTPAWQVLRPA